MEEEEEEDEEEEEEEKGEVTGRRKRERKKRRKEADAVRSKKGRDERVLYVERLAGKPAINRTDYCPGRTMWLA